MSNDTLTYDGKLDDIQYYLDEARKCRVVPMQLDNLRKASLALGALVVEKKAAVEEPLFDRRKNSG